jgi:hypothetical protein
MNHGIVSCPLVGPFNVGSKSIRDSKLEPHFLKVRNGAQTGNTFFGCICVL